MSYVRRADVVPPCLLDTANYIGDAGSTKYRKSSTRRDEAFYQIAAQHARVVVVGLRSFVNFVSSVNAVDLTPKP